MTLNHEMPRNSDTDATQSTNNSVLAPNSFMTDSRLCPTTCPTMPPAVSLKPSGEKCRVDSAQLVTSVARKPPKRRMKSIFVSACCVFCSRYSIQPR